MVAGWAASGPVGRLRAGCGGGGTGGGASVSIGNDHTFTSANEGDSGGWSSGLASWDASYSIYYRRGNAANQAVGIGSGNAWAWTAVRFTVTGSGSRLAYVDLSGWAAAELLGGFGGESTWVAKARLYDATAQTYVGEHTLFSASSTNNVPVQAGGSYGNSILASLQAGHTYVALVLSETAVNQYGIPPESWVARAVSKTESDHTRWDQINVRWQ